MAGNSDERRDACGGRRLMQEEKGKANGNFVPMALYRSPLNAILDFLVYTKTGPDGDEVSEREDRMLLYDIEKLKLANEEVDGDEDSEEDTCMGKVDLTKAGVGTE
uniref:Uncharacterized protein n=1 Tax=Leersia perrieri TaxID=77586 RepID=A0A0D9X386_9ORYZ